MAQIVQRPWLRPGWRILPTKISYCLNANYARRFWCEDKTVNLTYVQPHYYRVRQVEPCDQLGWSRQVVFLSNWTLEQPCYHPLPNGCNYRHVKWRDKMIHPFVAAPFGNTLHDISPQKKTLKRLYQLIIYMNSSNSHSLGFFEL